MARYVQRLHSGIRTVLAAKAIRINLEFSTVMIRGRNNSKQIGIKGTAKTASAVWTWSKKPGDLGKARPNRHRDGPEPRRQYRARGFRAPAILLPHEGVQVVRAHSGRQCQRYVEQLRTVACRASRPVWTSSA